MSNLEKYISELESLEAKGNLRRLPNNDSNSLDLSSNDYLGLNQDQKLYEEFLNNISSDAKKPSAASSRLLSGNTFAHQNLESAISRLYGKEALIYNSGYHANTGILPALAGKNDLIIADKLVHASLIDGMRLSQATSMRFAHCNYAHLETLLEKHRADFENVFIVSESVFSMDGDVADLEKLVALKRKHDAFLYFDEAHSVGVLGRKGLGLAEEKDLLKEVDFLVCCLGKALASVGAFVACRYAFKKYLINYSRSLIFSTALPPINLAWSNFLFERIESFSSKRENLKNLSVQFANSLGQKAESHIVPFVVGENESAISLSKELKTNGFNVLPIRYPTVLKGTARLRFSLNANMSFKELQPIIQLLQKHEQTLAQ